MFLSLIMNFGEFREAPQDLHSNSLILQSINLSQQMSFTLVLILTPISLFNLCIIKTYYLNSTVIRVVVGCVLDINLHNHLTFILFSSKVNQFTIIKD